MRAVAILQQDDLARLQAANHLRRVACGDELHFGECFFKRRRNVALPGRVQMNIELINDHDATGIRQNVFSYVWV